MLCPGEQMRGKHLHLHVEKPCPGVRLVVASFDASEPEQLTREGKAGLQTEPVPPGIAERPNGRLEDYEEQHSYRAAKPPVRYLLPIFGRSVVPVAVTRRDTGLSGWVAGVGLARKN